MGISDQLLLLLLLHRSVEMVLAVLVLTVLLLQPVFVVASPQVRRERC